MAIPKVFVSSTCFDLKEIRDSLSRFIKSFGFDPILSEHGDVFYHPDLHTHESCIHEVSNCQLFILIIGGRFGGTYEIDKNKSITNAEYDAARESNIPVFTYIKKGVHDNHHTFQVNKNKTFIKEMDFPHIEKQENALNIFDFIDQVRKSKTNNAFETFETAHEIESHIRKQWAGMFFDYLKNREVKEQVNVANIMLSALQTSSEKLEEIMKGLYKPERDKDDTLENIEHKYSAIKFFGILSSVAIQVKREFYLGEIEDLKLLSEIEPNKKTWIEYLINLGIFYLVDKKDYKVLQHKPKNLSEHLWGLIISTEKIEDKVRIESRNKEFEDFYQNGILKLSYEERSNVIKKFLKITDEELK